MRRKRIVRPRAAAVMIATVAVTLGGCGGFRVNPSEWFAKTDNDSRPVSGAEGGFTVTRGGFDEPVRRAVTASDLVGPDGRCETVSAESAAIPRGVGLTMTECELVTVAGAPDNVNVGTDGGDRRVVMTYGKGEHPGVYTFVAGRLKIIDRLPAPPKPEPRRRTPRQQRT
jgi:hypothetical protein